MPAARVRLPAAGRAQNLLDVGLAVLLCGIGLAWPRAVTGSALPVAAGVALVAGQSLPLAVRRTAPRAVFVVVALAAVAYGLAGFAGSPIDLGELIALYTVATSGRLADTAGALAAAVIGLALVATHNVHWGGPAETLAVVLVFALVAAVGRHQRLRAIRLSEAREHAADLERRQEEHAALVAAEERLRLAEELHDVVGHCLSIVLLQASLARRALDDHPERAAAAVGVIEDRARSAMEEMQSLVSALRDEDAEPRARTPAIDEIDRLVLDVAAAGIALDLRVRGAPRPLPELIEVSACRIVQEALTNVVRHSHAQHATVCVAYGEEALEVEITDDGVGDAPTPRPNGGHGLIGMRERAMRLGGTLVVDQTAGRGFRVLARLPVRQPARATGQVVPR